MVRSIHSFSSCILHSCCSDKQVNVENTIYCSALGIDMNRPLYDVCSDGPHFSSHSCEATFCLLHGAEDRVFVLRENATDPTLQWHEWLQHELNVFTWKSYQITGIQQSLLNWPTEKFHPRRYEVLSKFELPSLLHCLIYVLQDSVPEKIVFLWPDIYTTHFWIWRETSFRTHCVFIKRFVLQRTVVSHWEKYLYIRRQ